MPSPGHLVLLGLLALPAGNGKLDLNSATPAQLRALPGMGDEYVRRVIRHRPYAAKNQLSTRGILPIEEYRRIEDLVVAHRVEDRPKK